jgi:RNA polymerase sigma-70 factor (ECF subfamily)
LATEQELSDFLKGVELRAFKRAAYHLRDEDAALDVVQDAMLKLARQYADRPVAEFPMLFQRILSTTMLDWFRRRKVQSALFSSAHDLHGGGGDEDADFDALEALITSQAAGRVESAESAVERSETLAAIEQEVQGLPARQREAFLLRYWEEMDVAETAAVMGCSEGSVKTHCSRAVHALAKALGARGLRR